MPICTLTVQLNPNGTFTFDYTAEEGQEIPLGMFSIILGKLLVTTLENPAVRIPTTAERAGQVAAVEAAAPVEE